MRLGDLPQEPNAPHAPDSATSIRHILELTNPWMRTREAYGPVWWPEFKLLSGLEIDRSQFNLMRIIAHGPARSLREIAFAAMLSASTASRLIESFVQLGLVERVVPSEDRRVTLIQITRRGRDLIDMSEHIGASLLAGPLSHLTDDEVRMFTDVFTRLAAIVETWARDPEAWREDARRRRLAEPGPQHWFGSSASQDADGQPDATHRHSKGDE